MTWKEVNAQWLARNKAIRSRHRKARAKVRYRLRKKLKKGTLDRKGFATLRRLEKM